MSEKQSIKQIKGNFSNVRITEKLLKNNPNFSDLLLKMSHKTEKQKETYEEEEKIIISEISEILSDFRLYQMNMEQYQKFPLKNTENIYLELENFYLAFTTFDKLKLSKNETEKINLLGIHFQKPDLKSLSIEVKREIDFRIDQKLLKISSFFSLDSMDELENFLMERKLKEISNQEIENENNENYSVKLQEKYKKLLKSMKDIAKFVQQYKIENSKLKEEFILSLQSKIKFFELKVEILKLDTLNEVYSEEVSQLLSKIYNSLQKELILQQNESLKLKSKLQKYESMSGSQLDKYLSEYSTLKKVLDEKQWMLENMK